MKLKNLIFIGIILLVSGIILRIEGSHPALALTIMLSGVACKLTYVIISIIRKTYRPGKEMLLLYIGMAVFFTGLYFRRHGLPLGVPLEIMGISMKLTFIYLFVSIMKGSKA